VSETGTPRPRPGPGQRPVHRPVRRLGSPERRRSVGRGPRRAARV